MERASQGEHREPEQSNQVKQMRVGSLEGQLEENCKDLLHAARLKSD